MFAGINRSRRAVTLFAGKILEGDRFIYSVKEERKRSTAVAFYIVRTDKIIFIRKLIHEEFLILSEIKQYSVKTLELFSQNRAGNFIRTEFNAAELRFGDTFKLISEISYGGGVVIN
jgi:hypothetical protein